MINISGVELNIIKIIIPIIYILIGIVIFRLVKKIIIKATNTKKNLKTAQKQRINTLRTLVINIIKYAIYILVILAILSHFGVNVKSILAGLGIGTALIGLAFQDLAKDIIAGITIITEGSYDIGDTIEIEGFMGEVVFIGLRSTRIRNFKGATKIIANRYMDNIINYSFNNSLAVVDVSIAYECDEDKVEKVFTEMFEKLNGHVPNATKDLELWGVNDLSDSAVVYRIVVETLPMKHVATERFLKKEIKKALDASNVKIPYQQIEVHNGK
jgi:small conductance mechanosensitive channel